MIHKLLQHSGQPKLYEPGTAFMWTDDHISKQLLQVHLNPDIDLASRKLSTIDATAGWILQKAPHRRLDIIDLGCGPGLYAERFARQDHRVTGVDISECSITHAIGHAAAENLSITYENRDYLSFDQSAAYDLAILVYTDMGVLLPADRDTVLRNVHRALRPGGVFIFDVLNVNHRDEKLLPKNWEVSAAGFWRPHPFVALSESFLYPDDNVILYQNIVGDDNGVDVYRFWTHLFSDDAIAAMIKGAGFSSCENYTDVLPEGDVFSGENVTFCVAVK